MAASLSISTSANGEICVTVTGLAGLPNAHVSFDGSHDVRIRDVKYLGNGTWKFCFTKPPGTGRAHISVSGSGGTVVTGYA